MNIMYVFEYVCIMIDHNMLINYTVYKYGFYRSNWVGVYTVYNVCMYVCMNEYNYRSMYVCMNITIGTYWYLLKS